MMTNPSIDWPPAYQLRRSRRAKRISLSFHPERGLELIVPQRASERDALFFLHQHRDWVLKHADLLKSLPPSSEFIYPQRLQLPALDKSYSFIYEEIANARRVSLLAEANRLVFVGATKNFDLCLKCLHRWLKRQAELHLPGRVEEISKKLNLPYTQLTFRGQKTLWGSCSRDKEISLNYKLLLLPLRLVDYVIIHELCHTKYLNHSQKFWQLVAKHESQFKSLKKELRRSDDILPQWFKT